MTSQTQQLTHISIHSVSTMPRVVKIINQDGVWTGALRTQHQSVALGSDSKPRVIPAGAILWPSTSSGMDGTLNVCVVRPRVNGEHSDIRYRAR